MNATLSTRVDEQHQPHPPSARPATTPRQVSLPDRVALHVGLALVTWSRRPRTAPVEREYNPRERQEAERARRRREEQWQRATLVTRSWR